MVWDVVRARRVGHWELPGYADVACSVAFTACGPPLCAGANRAPWLGLLARAPTARRRWTVTSVLIVVPWGCRCSTSTRLRQRE